MKKAIIVVALLAAARWYVHNVNPPAPKPEPSATHALEQCLYQKRLEHGRPEYLRHLDVLECER